MPNHPDLFWDPHSFLVSSFPGVKQLGVMLTTCLHLVLRLRRSGAIHLLPHMPSWHEQGQVYFFLFFQNNKNYYYISNFMCILSRHQVCDWHIKNICHFSQLEKMYQLLQNYVIMVETTCLSTKKAGKKERIKHLGLFSSSSIGTTAHFGLWPVEKCPSIFSYLPPILSIFSLPALEDLFLLPLSIFSRVPSSSHPFQFLSEDLLGHPILLHSL